MSLFNPIFQVDDCFAWVNLRHYSRQALRTGQLKKDVLAQLNNDPTLRVTVESKIILFDSLYEGHGRSDFELARDHSPWHNSDRCRWIGNVFDDAPMQDSELIPGYMINHCGFLDHVRSLNIDWANLPRESMLVCLMRRPGLTRHQVCRHILKNYQEFDPVLSYGSLLDYQYFDENLKCNMPILLDGVHSRGNDYHLLTDARVFDSLINVVAETSDQLNHDGEFGYDTLFVTEKTFKAFAWHQIPVWIAVPGFVDCVRLMGFDVFDDLVDHSYDKIQDYKQRLAAALASLDNLISRVDKYGIQKLHQNLLDRFKQNDVVLNRTRRLAKLSYQQGLERLRESL